MIGIFILKVDCPLPIDIGEDPNLANSQFTKHWEFEWSVGKKDDNNKIPTENDKGCWEIC